MALSSWGGRQRGSSTNPHGGGEGGEKKKDRLENSHLLSTKVGGGRVIDPISFKKRNSQFVEKKKKGDEYQHQLAPCQKRKNKGQALFLSIQKGNSLDLHRRGDHSSRDTIGYVCTVRRKRRENRESASIITMKMRKTRALRPTLYMRETKNRDALRTIALVERKEGRSRLCMKGKMAGHAPQKARSKRPVKGNSNCPLRFGA